MSAAAAKAEQHSYAIPLATSGGGPIPDWQYAVAQESMFLVNAASGNLYLPVFGVQLVTSSPSLEVLFHYNSIDLQDHSGVGMGVGWSHSFSHHLSFPETGVGLWQVGDGRQVYFKQKANGTWKLATSSRGAGVSLARDAGAGEWTITGKKNLTLHFGDGDQGWISSISNHLQNDLVFEYASAGLSKITQVATGRFVEFSYRSDGRLESIFDDSSAQSCWLTYNAAGRLQDIFASPWGGVVMTYQGNGRLRTFTDPEGHTWTFGYDGLGRVDEVLDPSPPAAANTRRTLSYLTAPNSQTTTYTDVRGNDWVVEFDSFGSSARKKSVTDPLCRTWNYTYNGKNKIKTLTDPLAKTWTITYDANGDPRIVKDPLDNTQVYTYDLNRNLVTASNGTGNLTTLKYESPDSPWLLTSIEQLADTSGTVAVTTFDHFSMTGPAAKRGLVKSITDPVGMQTRFDYDVNGRLESEEEGLASNPGVSMSWYNGGANRTRTYAQPSAIAYPADFPAQPADPASIQPLDVFSQAVKDRLGRYTYLSDNISVDLGGNYSNSNRTQLLSYDWLGRPTSYSYTTDEPGTATPITRSYTTSYFDLNDGTWWEVMSTPHSATHLIKYDQAGQVTTKTFFAGSLILGSVNYEYYDDGRLKASYKDNGTSTHFVYLDNGLLESMDLRDDTDSLLLCEYSYDALGFLRGIEESEGGVPSASVSYEYDGLGRLTSEERYELPSGAAVILRDYQYDLAGNRLWSRDVIADTETDYEYDYQDVSFGTHNNRLMRTVKSVTSSGSVLDSSWFYYDTEFGHMSDIVTQDSSGNFGSVSFDYTTQGSRWLTREAEWTVATSPNYTSATESRVFAAQDYMTRRLDPYSLAPLDPMDTWWCDPLMDPLSYYSVDPATSDVTVRQANLLGISTTDEYGEASYLHSNPVGGVQRMTDVDGVLEGELLQTAFGVSVLDNLSGDWRFAGAYGARQGFQGQAFTATELTNVGERIYAPSLGRFTMRDPSGVRSGSNVFAFAGSRPTQFVDTNGLEYHSPDPDAMDGLGRDPGGNLYHLPPSQAGYHPPTRDPETGYYEPRMEGPEFWGDQIVDNIKDKFKDKVVDKIVDYIPGGPILKDLRDIFDIDTQATPGPGAPCTHCGGSGNEPNPNN